MKLEKRPTGSEEIPIEEINEYFEAVQHGLNYSYGVKNLTTAELFRIRKDIEKILKENRRLRKETSIQQQDDHVMEVITETTARFLLSYGIDLNSLPNGGVGRSVDKALIDYISEKVNIARDEDNKL